MTEVAPVDGLDTPEEHKENPFGISVVLRWKQRSFMHAQKIRTKLFALVSSPQLHIYSRLTRAANLPSGVCEGSLPLHSRAGSVFFKKYTIYQHA